MVADEGDINLLPWREQRRQFLQRRLFCFAVSSVLLALLLIFVVTQIYLVSPGNLALQQVKVLRRKLSVLNTQVSAFKASTNRQIKQYQVWKAWLANPYLRWFDHLFMLLESGSIKSMRCESFQCHFVLEMHAFGAISQLLVRIRRIYPKAKLRLGKIKQRQGAYLFNLDVNFFGSIVLPDFDFRGID